jgi:hypothetical protein
MRPCILGVECVGRSGKPVERANTVGIAHGEIGVVTSASMGDHPAGGAGRYSEPLVDY